VGIAWFFLGLGVALLGLACVVAVLWYRQRRFERGLLTLTVALLLAGLAAQEIFLGAAAATGRRALDHAAFLAVSAATAAIAAVLIFTMVSRSGRENLRESRERPRRIREVEALAAIARLSSEGGTLEEVGAAILDAARPVVGADACILLLLDREHQVLQGHAASGMPDESWRTFDVPVTDGFNRHLLARGGPIVIDDVERERRLKMTLARKIGAASALVAPVRYEDRPIGSLTFYALGEPRRFDDASVAFAELIAKEAAAVLERMHLEEKVEEQREQAARVLEHVGDGVFFADAEGVVRLWNPAAAEITGIQSVEVVGRRPEDALPGWMTIAPLVPLSTAPAFAAGHSETLPLDVGGRELWLSITGVEFPDGTVYAFRDLTEERNLDKLKRDFVATVSHELRTPLAAVYGAAMTLRRNDLVLDEAQRERLLAMVERESDRLARIINEVLAASRLDAGTFPLLVESCDPASLARQVVETSRVHLPPGVAVEVRLEDALPPVAADRDMVRQVLTNLLENAVKYSPAGGVVHVSLESQRGRVLFGVRDEGLGIPLHEQKRIFEKFYRLDPDLTRGVGGTGLGLYICRELVRRMGGRIWVASRENEGSTFFFELPIAEDGQPRESVSAEKPVEAATGQH
jgi:PAS domain S-box-containing protein